jgi:sorbitol-specific phosphotransferase system component IIC
MPAVALVYGGVASGSGIPSLALFALAVFYLVSLAVVQAALQGIFQAALYQYARKGETPRGFERDVLNEAITPRSFG